MPPGPPPHASPIDPPAAEPIWGLPPLARWSLAWLLGIGLATRLTAPPSLAHALALLVATGAACALAHRQLAGAPRHVRALPALALCLVLGAVRGAAAIPDLSGGHVAAWIDAGPVALRGTIARPPDRRDRGTDYVVAVDGVRRGEAGAWEAARGLVLAQASRFPARAVGDRVLVTGTLEAASDGPGFDYRAYLAQRGIHALVRRPGMATLERGHAHAVRRALDALRDRARGVLNASLPEPAAGLAIGILLGDARGIPRPLDDAFRVTGTTHIIAISGSNIALLVAMLSATLGRVLGRSRAAPATLGCVALYTVLVGADPAVVRAALMGSVLVLGDVLGRPTHAPTALLAAAWTMTAWRPAVLGDLGFQLSFAATAGLVAFARPMTAGLAALLAARGITRGRAVLGAVEEPLLVTLAAQATTWPLIAVRTGQFSIVSLGANLLVVPVQPLVMALGGLTVLAGALWAPAGRAVGAAAWLPLAFSIAVVEHAARVPYAAVALVLPTSAAVAYYAVLLGIAGGRARLRHAAGFVRRARLAVPAMALGPSPTSQFVPRLIALARGWPGTVVAVALAALAWSGAAHRPDGLLHVHVLDVGQGDALLIVTPTGRRMLIDGGPSPSAVLAELGRRLPPWDRRLDVVVLTHPDADHIGGLAAVLARYRVGWVVDSAVPHHTAEVAEFEARAAAEVAGGARRVTATTGLEIMLDGAANVGAVALWPPDEAVAPGGSVNDRSIILRVTYGRTSFLFTGDIEEPVETRLLGQGAPLATDVLKVAHHGSDTSSTPAFVAAVHPALALISVGVGNRFGHPTAGAIERLAGAQIRRTDQEGAIEVLSDGTRLWVRGR